MLTLYGYKKCATCRKAEKYLQAAGREYQFIDITEQPPTAVELSRIATQAAVEPRKLFNTSGVQYRELDIKSRLPQMTEKQIWQLLAGNGRLIKRPLLTDGRSSTVGFNEQAFDDTWA